MLPALAGGRAQPAERLVDLAENAVERLLRYLGAVAEGQQRLALPLELLQQVGLQVGASGHVEHLEQRTECNVMVERMLATCKELEAIEQIFEPQQRPDAFVQRVLVQDQGVVLCRGRRRARCACMAVDVCEWRSVRADGRIL